jgi:adenylate cyclase
MLGDGAMVVFSNAEAAAPAAAEMVRDWPEGLPALHIGIGVGRLLERDGDYFGATVNLASRLSQAAQAGQVLVARPDGAAPRIPGLRRLGAMTLRGMAEPMQAYQLNPLRRVPG